MYLINLIDNNTKY